MKISLKFALILQMFSASIYLKYSVLEQSLFAQTVIRLFVSLLSDDVKSKQDLNNYLYKVFTMEQDRLSIILLRYCHLWI